MHDITDSEFDSRVVRAARPVVLDFWAPWCEPCREVDPLLDRLAAKYEGAVEFLRMNIDEERDKPAEYAVTSLPTILFFKSGELANQIIGAGDEATIEQAIRKLL